MTKTAMISGQSGRAARFHHQAADVGILRSAPRRRDTAATLMFLLVYMAAFALILAPEGTFVTNTAALTAGR